MIEHARRTEEFVDTFYYFWAKAQTNPGMCLRSYICWVEARYRIDVDKELLHHKGTDIILRPVKQEKKASIGWKKDAFRKE